jgi:hypothetical protein
LRLFIFHSPFSFAFARFPRQGQSHSACWSQGSASSFSGML